MRPLVLVGFWFASFGCGGPAPLTEDSPGTLSVAWDGTEEGRFLGPATGSWCAADSMLEVTATRGDTGVGLALFVTDTVRQAMHPVLSGDVPADWRPLGRAAIRWVGAADVIGYQGTGGVISVTATDSGVSGTVDVRLLSNNGIDTLHMTGGFKAVSVSQAAGVCGLRDRRGLARRDSVLP
jgi:hypothetical protein